VRAGGHKKEGKKWKLRGIPADEKEECTVRVRGGKVDDRENMVLRKRPKRMIRSGKVRLGKGGSIRVKKK